MAGSGFALADISIEILQVDEQVVLVEIATPIGKGKLLGELRFQGETLYIDKAHVEGLAPGGLGRAGINLVLKKLLVTADVERLVIQGARRTTGRYRGQVPRPIVFPH